VKSSSRIWCLDVDGPDAAERSEESGGRGCSIVFIHGISDGDGA
jgi:hypothetical protein